MRIPSAYFDGGFGQRVEKPRAGVAPDLGAGQEIAQAGQNLGAALLGTATQMIDEQGTIDLMNARAKTAEAQRQEAERTAELKRLEEAKARSGATTALVSHENTLSQLAGELAKDPNMSVEEKRDQFRTMADQTKASFMAQVPELYQYAFSPTFDEHRNAASATLDTALGAQITHQAKANIYTTMEELERSAKPLESKLAIMRSIPDEVWRGAGVNAADQAVAVQGAADKMSRAELDHLLNNRDPREVLQQLKAQHTWGKRADGSEKGNGWLGVLNRPDGGVSSEISIGVNINGKDVEIPSMVPGLTREEVAYLLENKVDRPGLFRTPIGKVIMQKAVDHAQGRMAEGKSPFIDAPANGGTENLYSNFRDLEPSSREAYIATAKSRIHAMDVEAERRRKEAATERDRQAGKAFDEYKDARSGLMQLSATREAQLWKTMSGTDYVGRAKEVRRTTGSISFIAEKLNKDPLTYGAAQKGMVVPPLDANNPQAWQSQLQARGELAGAIKRANKLTYLPILKNEEATAMAGYLKNQTAQGQVQSATGFLLGFGRESTERIAGQFAANDTSLGMVVALVANDRPGAAYHVANGEALSKEKVQLKKPQNDDLQSRLDGYLGDALTGQPQMRAAYSSAVKSAYISMASTEGVLDGSIDTKIFDKAAREVVGGVAKVNGKRVLLPTGVDEHAFKDFVRGIGADSVKRAGGVNGYGTDEAAADSIRGGAQLYEAGNGRYRFTIQGKPLQNKAGAPFELTLGYHDVKGVW